MWCVCGVCVCVGGVCVKLPPQGSVQCVWIVRRHVLCASLDFLSESFISPGFVLLESPVMKDYNVIHSRTFHLQ